MESVCPGQDFYVVVKGIQVCSLKESESKEPSLGCSSSAGSTRRVLSARFVEKPNTFLGWEMELELAPVAWGWGLPWRIEDVTTEEAYCPSYSGHSRAGDVVASHAFRNSRWFPSNPSVSKRLN